METKTCTVCKLSKSLTIKFFLKASPSAPTADGWKGRCRLCTRKYKNGWRADFKEEFGEHDGKLYQQTHREDAAHRSMRVYYELSEWVNSLKDKPCMDCGGSFPAVCMDYDHRPGEKKKALIAWMVSNRYSRKAILEEIAKCDLVCANCHRVRTWDSGREMPWYDKIRKYGAGI